MENEQVASHSEDVQEPQRPSQEDIDAILRDQFGITPTDQREEPEEKEEPEEEEQEIDENPPATEESKKLKVKFNKQEVEIDEDKIPEYVQKGLALEKERERKSELEKALDRAAKLQGFKDHADFLANLDELESKAAKQREDQFASLRNELREQAEEAGLDPDKVDEYIDNHPLLRQAKEIIEKEQQNQQLQQQQQAKEREIRGWEELFAAYPHLAEETSEDGANAPWLTAEMKARIDRGYDPKDAYELTHRDVIEQERKKKAEQEVLKQQRLNKRAKVEGNTVNEPEDDAPEEVKSAFAMFGLDPRTAKKFVRK